MEKDLTQLNRAINLITTNLLVAGRQNWFWKPLQRRSRVGEAFSFFKEGIDMLVLTRRIGEKIVIGGDIQITVVAVQGNKIRLGITAPPDVVVDRQEISERRLQSRGRNLPGWNAHASSRDNQVLSPVH